MRPPPATTPVGRIRYFREVAHTVPSTQNCQTQWPLLHCCQHSPLYQSPLNLHHCPCKSQSWFAACQLTARCFRPQGTAEPDLCPCHLECPPPPGFPREAPPIPRHVLPNVASPVTTSSGPLPQSPSLPMEVNTPGSKCSIALSGGLRPPDTSERLLMSGHKSKNHGDAGCA